MMLRDAALMFSPYTRLTKIYPCQKLLSLLSPNSKYQPEYNFQAGLGLVLVATLVLATATLCGKAKQKEEENEKQNTKEKE